MDDASSSETTSGGSRMRDVYHHVTIRPRADFAEFRTPFGSDGPPGIGPAGCDIREGRLGPDTWAVQSVLVPCDAVDSRVAAEQLAKRIVAARES